MFLARYFKTGKGQYGEGDIFLGISVPNMKLVAKQFARLSLEEIAELLKSSIHEERQVALQILVIHYKKGKDEDRKQIYEFYLDHTQSVNN